MTTMTDDDVMGEVEMLEEDTKKRDWRRWRWIQRRGSSGTITIIIIAHAIIIIFMTTHTSS